MDLANSLSLRLELAKLQNAHALWELRSHVQESHLGRVNGSNLVHEPTTWEGNAGILQENPETKFDSTLQPSAGIDAQQDQKLPASYSQTEVFGTDNSFADWPNQNVLKSAEFRMYSFKIEPCKRKDAHDAIECPFAHPGEKARRRDPRLHKYRAVPCPDYRKESCRRGDACELSHGVFESWLHPSKYCTSLCKNGPTCARKVCFFAHSLEELRQPEGLCDDVGEQSELPITLADLSSLDLQTKLWTDTTLSMALSRLHFLKGQQETVEQKSMKLKQLSLGLPLSTSSTSSFDSPPPSLSPVSPASLARVESSTGSDYCLDNMLYADSHQALHQQFSWQPSADVYTPSYTMPMTHELTSSNPSYLRLLCSPGWNPDPSWAHALHSTSPPNLQYSGYRIANTVQQQHLTAAHLSNYLNSHQVYMFPNQRIELMS